MNHKLTIKKGLDLKIEGAVSNPASVKKSAPKSVAIIPDDFSGFVPKVEVKEGDTVAVGSPLLFDKRDNEVKLVSPVNGVVEAIVRGERRKIERVVVRPTEGTAAGTKATEGTTAEAKAQQSTNGVAAEAKAPQLTTAEEIRAFLKRSGMWAMMRQRPYDIVPAGDSIPRDIFITAIDSAPLAVDPAQILADKAAELAAGVKLLKKLTQGAVYIARREGSALPDIAGAEMIDVAGPHPAGNVGVHIANIKPVNKGETVWTLDATTLWRIGVAATTGVVPSTVFVAVTGSEVKQPQVVETVVGADINSIIGGNIKADDCHHRIISGNVLVGFKVDESGYLRFPYRQITVIPEGDDNNEFMGWASLSPKKMSQSRTFPGHFFRKIFNPDARLNGSKRAFIMSGEYEQFMPMDIMAEYLLKAIIGRDIDQMEKLGIYEVAPEDFALGEYADTSKMEAQQIVRDGLDFLRKELE